MKRFTIIIFAIFAFIATQTTYSLPNFWYSAVAYDAAGQIITTSPLANVTVDINDGTNTFSQAFAVVPVDAFGVFSIHINGAGLGIMAMKANTIITVKVNGVVVVGAPLSTAYYWLISTTLPPLATNHIFVGNAGVATDVAMSGDATIAASGALTLANTGVAAGAYGNATNVASFIVDSKGRLTSAGNTAIAFPPEVDGSVTNELNTSMSWVDGTNTIGVVDAGGTKSVVITGFLETETDPIYSASSWFTTTNNSANWNTAFGWGNHAGLYAPIAHVGATGAAHGLATGVVAGFMSSADFTKLGGIAAGAEVNVNADWNAVSGDAQILNKPTTLAGYGITDGVISSRTISTTAPLTGGGDLTANRTLSIPKATGSVDGYLAATDWTTFNSKQDAGSYITALTGDVTASGPGSVAATLATVNSNTGSFGTATNVAQFTVNGKGLITAAANVPIQITESQVTNLTTDLTNINTAIGTKVTANGAIAPGTNTKITYDAKGLVTAGTSLVATDIPNLDWSKITTGKPTTLAGYGITDAAPLSHVGATGAAHGNATGAVAGFMSSADKTKLDAITGTNTGDVTLTGQNYLTLSGQQITANAVNLASANVTGTLPVGNGGTNITTYATGDILYASAANTLSKLPVGTAGQVLKVAGGVPTWGTDNTGSGGTATTGQFTRTTAITGTTSTTGVMMGLSNTATFTFTPATSGKVLIIVSGNVRNTDNGRTTTISLRYGTGASPANGAALTGTVTGAPNSFLTYAGGSDPGTYPFSVQSIVSGLTVGTAIWIDLGLATSNALGTASISNITVSVVEL